MSPEPPLAASPPELTRHGETVEALAARADLCAAAARHVRLDAGAYGQLCAFVPSLLNGVITTADEASRGAGVHVTPVEPTHPGGSKNPDAIFRWSPDDPGALAEFKTLEASTSGAVRANIFRGADQLEPHGGGTLVIDGRPVGLSEADARRGYARAVGQALQHQQWLPDGVLVILGDGRLLIFPDR
jgi:hypothetical protein